MKAKPIGTHLLMWTGIALFAGSIFPNGVRAEDFPAPAARLRPAHSQARLPGESAADAQRRYLRERGLPETGALASDTALAQATPWSALKIRDIPDWTDDAYVTRAFRRVRDTRFLPDAAHPGKRRRSTWLYPDDGCYARSGLAERNLERWGYPRAAKLFVFGDLKVKTPNSPTGSVAWWYHEVPVIRYDRRVFVLDPAVEPRRPLALSTWVRRISPGGTTRLTGVVCAARAYVPEGECFGASDATDADARKDQLELLPSEWDRLVELGRDPVLELGNYPPWLSRSPRGSFGSYTRNVVPSTGPLRTETLPPWASAMPFTRLSPIPQPT